jgi:hypothetical protein
MSKLAFRAQTVGIAYLPLHKDLFAKVVLMSAQRDFRLGNSLTSPSHTCAEGELKILARFSLN